VTIHENSTTMILYGYVLAQYVVESCLVVPTSAADGVEALGIRLVGNEWAKEWTTLGTTRCKRGTLGDLDCHLW
jgi:hypothetical protein